MNKSMAFFFFNKVIPDCPWKELQTDRNQTFLRHSGREIIQFETFGNSSDYRYIISWTWKANNRVTFKRNFEARQGKGKKSGRTRIGNGLNKYFHLKSLFHCQQLDKYN